MRKAGVLTGFAAALALAATAAAVPAPEAQKKGKDPVQKVTEASKGDLEKLLRRLEKLEKDVEELRGKLTIEDLQEATRLAAASTCMATRGGSGFVLDIPAERAGKKYDPDRWYIQTAYHVMKNHTSKKPYENVSFIPYSHDGKTGPIPRENGRFEAEAHEDDLLLYSVPKKDVKQPWKGIPIRDVTENPLPEGAGHPVIVIGYPQKHFVARTAFLSSTDALWKMPAAQGGQTLKVLEAPLGPWNGIPGHSGGPMIMPEIDLTDGKRTVKTPAIGVMTAVQTERHIAAAVHPERIVQFLRKNEILAPAKTGK